MLRRIAWPVALWTARVAPALAAQPAVQPKAGEVRPVNLGEAHVGGEPIDLAQYREQMLPSFIDEVMALLPADVLSRPAGS